MALKSIDKKDMPKMVALSVLAVGLFGGVAYQFLAYPTPHQQAPADATGKVAGAGNAAPAAPGVLATGAVPGATGTAGAADPAAVATFDPATLGPPTGGKDPFLPLSTSTKLAAAPPPKIVSPVATPSMEAPKTDGLPIPIARALGKPTGPITFDATPKIEGLTSPLAGINHGAAGVQAVEVPPPPPPPYTVTGIVMGDRSIGDGRSVAILRTSGPGGSAPATPGASTESGAERRFVSVGDPVGNGFIVAAVRPDSVDLKSGSRRVTLKLGMGNNNRAN